MHKATHYSEDMVSREHQGMGSNVLWPDSALIHFELRVIHFNIYPLILNFTVLEIVMCITLNKCC